MTGNYVMEKKVQEMIIVRPAKYYLLKALGLAVALGIALMSSTPSHAAPSKELWAFWDLADNTNPAQIDHSSWSNLLQTYLVIDHPSGVNRFRYGDISAQDQQDLDQYLEKLQRLDPREYSSAEQKAYWVNFYNALTVDLILAVYPVSTIKKVKGGFFNTGPWEDKVVEVAGKKVSLNDMEHRILRPIWNDQRVHFAVNCASIGCPNLQQQAFTATNTEMLLDKAAKEFITHPRGVSLKGDKLVLSKIFDWYQEDFGENEREMLNTLNQFVSSQLAEQLKSFNGEIDYEYDWSLNSP